MQKQNKLLSVLLLITIVVQVIASVLPSLIGGFDSSNLQLGFYAYLPACQICSIIIFNVLAFFQFVGKFIFNTRDRPNYDQATLRFHKTQRRYFLFYAICGTLILLGSLSIFYSPDDIFVTGLYLITVWFAAAVINIPVSIAYFIFTLDSYKLFKKLSQISAATIEVATH